jgi:hypothetical protein
LTARVEHRSTSEAILGCPRYELGIFFYRVVGLVVLAFLDASVLRVACRVEAPASSAVAICQPWFYRRLVAYGFVGLCEGAYGGTRDLALNAWPS